MYVRHTLKKSEIEMKPFNYQMNEYLLAIKIVFSKNDNAHSTKP